MQVKRLLDKVKSVMKEDTCMQFYDEMKPLYLENDASGGHSGATILNPRDGTSFHRDEAPDNNILRPIAFGSKSLLASEKDTVT